jgi:hypothetical protein
MTAGSKAQVIRAVGGVLWRDLTGHVEIALVHRPKHDAWSLPAGALTCREHPLCAALRTVGEQTGYTAIAGRPLGQATCRVGPALERARYWAMRDTGGMFTPGAEIDALEWMPLEIALERSGRHHGQRALAAFAVDPAPTRAWLLLRHASAGDRAAWSGEDVKRPLDEHGRAQAAALVPILAAYGVRRLVSADVCRCLETLEPYAQQAGLAVEPEPLFGAEGHASAPPTTLQPLTATVVDPRPTVVCSQREAIPGLLRGLCAVLGVTAPADPHLAKGHYRVLHVTTASHPVRVVEIEHGHPLTALSCGPGDAEHEGAGIGNRTDPAA